MAMAINFYGNRSRTRCIGKALSHILDVALSKTFSPDKSLRKKFSNVQHLRCGSGPLVNDHRPDDRRRNCKSEGSFPNIMWMWRTVISHWKRPNENGKNIKHRLDRRLRIKSIYIIVPRGMNSKNETSNNH